MLSTKITIVKRSLKLRHFAWKNKKIAIEILSSAHINIIQNFPQNLALKFSFEHP